MTGPSGDAPWTASMPMSSSTRRSARRSTGSRGCADQATDLRNLLTTMTLCVILLAEHLQQRQKGRPFQIERHVKGCRNGSSRLAQCGLFWAASNGHTHRISALTHSTKQASLSTLSQLCSTSKHSPSACSGDVFGNGANTAAAHVGHVCNLTPLNFKKHRHATSVTYDLFPTRCPDSAPGQRSPSGNARSAYTGISMPLVRSA